MQKKNRKGFTLIELLAVIVILAIIALIAVPVIMNVITKARVSAFEDSAYGIVKAGEMYYTNKLLDTESMTGDKEFIISNSAFEGDALDVSGSIPSSGKVTVTSEGKVALAISNGEYCIRKATTESSVKAEKLSDLGGICNYKTVFTTANDGTEVPACITNNTTCSTDDIKNGLKVGVKVNDSETKDFYVMSDNTSKNEITLLMSENLGETVAWYADAEDNSKGPITSLNELKKRTLGWTNIPETTYDLIDDNTTSKYEIIKGITARARLITHSEATGLGCEDYTDGTCPNWLYKNTGSSYENYGYWTSSALVDNSGSAWFVNSSGSTHRNATVTADFYCGIRPVITVSKSIL